MGTVSRPRASSRARRAAPRRASRTCLAARLTSSVPPGPLVGARQREVGLDAVRGEARRRLELGDRAVRLAELQEHPAERVVGREEVGLGLRRRPRRRAAPPRTGPPSSGGTRAAAWPGRGRAAWRARAGTRRGPPPTPRRSSGRRPSRSGRSGSSGIAGDELVEGEPGGGGVAVLRELVDRAPGDRDHLPLVGGDLGRQVGQAQRGEAEPLDDARAVLVDEGEVAQDLAGRLVLGEARRGGCPAW